MRSVSETRGCLRRLSRGQRVLYRVGTLTDTHPSGTSIEVPGESIKVPAAEGTTYVLWPVTEVFMRSDAQIETKDNGAELTYYYFYTDQRTANSGTGNKHAAALKLNQGLVRRLAFDTTSYRYYIHTQAHDEKIRHAHKQKDLVTLVFVNKTSGEKRLLCETCDKIDHPAYDCPTRPRDTHELLLVNENEWHHPLVDNYGLFRCMRENGLSDRSKALPWNLRDGGRADPETGLAPLECMANANDCLFYCIAFVLDPNVHFLNSLEQRSSAITKARGLRQEACDWIEKNLINKSYSSLYHTSKIIDGDYISDMRETENRMTSILEAYALCCIYKIRVDLYSFTTQPASCSLVVPRASDIHDRSFDYNEGMTYFCSLYNQKDSHWKVYTKGGEKQVDDGFFKSETAGAVMNTGGLYKDALYHDII